MFNLDHSLFILLSEAGKRNINFQARAKNFPASTPDTQSCRAAIAICNGFPKREKMTIPFAYSQKVYVCFPTKFPYGQPFERNGSTLCFLASSRHFGGKVNVPWTQMPKNEAPPMRPRRPTRQS